MQKWKSWGTGGISTWVRPWEVEWTPGSTYRPVLPRVFPDPYPVEPVLPLPEDPMPLPEPEEEFMSSRFTPDGVPLASLSYLPVLSLSWLAGPVVLSKARCETPVPSPELSAPPIPRPVDVPEVPEVPE